MSLDQAIHYRRRAEEFLRLGNVGIDPESMEWAHSVGLSATDRLCPNAAGVLYVHAGIAMTDAVLMFLTGVRSTAQDHSQAANRLEKECGKQHFPHKGVKHFRWLVQHKDFFAYDDERVSLNDAKDAKTKIERFLSWAFETFPEIGRDD